MYINEEVCIVSKIKGRNQEISYVYNSKHEISHVQISYPLYLELVKDKRGKLIENSIPEWEVGYDILISSIQSLRDQGYTLRSIAEKMEVQQPYLSKLLSKKRQLKPQTLERISRCIR